MTAALILLAFLAPACLLGGFYAGYNMAYRAYRGLPPVSIKPTTSAQEVKPTPKEQRRYPRVVT